MSILQTHLSRRAYEWLTKCVTIYGNGQMYLAPVGAAACGVEVGPMRVKLHLCSTEDVRALYLGMDYKVVFNIKEPRPFGSPDWVRKPIQVITCNECRVLFDRACESSPRKTGGWYEVTEKGIAIWHRPEEKTKKKAASQ